MYKYKDWWTDGQIEKLIKTDKWTDMQIEK
jgi:hypothetical protein